MALSFSATVKIPSLSCPGRLRLGTSRVPWSCPFFWATTRLAPAPIVNN